MTLSYLVGPAGANFYIWYLEAHRAISRKSHNAIYDKLFEVILKVLPLTVEIWKHVGRLYWKFCRKRAADLPVAARDYLPPSDTRCGSRVYARGCCIGSRMPRGRRRSVAASRGPHLDIA